jgi:hypothetical protein
MALGYAYGEGLIAIMQQKKGEGVIDTRVGKLCLEQITNKS